MSFRMLFSLAALCVLAAASTALAEEPAITTSQELGYVAKYVWRGLPVNPDGAIQPSVTVSHTNGLSFNIWGSMDTTDYAGESGSLTEIDYTLDYAWETSGRSANAGIIHYTFPKTGFANTDEVYASLSFGGDFAPSVSLNYDFKEADGYYLSFGAGRDWSVPWGGVSPTTFSISANLGLGSSRYNDFYFYGVDKTALTDLSIGVTLPFQVTDRMTIQPSINYSHVISSDLRNALKTNGLDPDNLFAGLTVSFGL